MGPTNLVNKEIILLPANETHSMKNILLLFAIAMAIISCSKSKNDYTFKNDFEGIWGWSENLQIRKGNAHSGNFCIEVNGNDQYSMTFKSKLSDLGKENISTINAKAWIKFSTPECQAKLIVAIDSTQGAAAALWMGANAEDVVVKPNEWYEISNNVKLPKYIKPDYKLLVYVWCNGKDPVLADDISIEAR